MFPEPSAILCSKPTNRIRGVILTLITALIFFSFSTPTGAMLLKTGVRNQTVLQIQEWLSLMGYLRHHPTGYYGPLTEEAVKDFQVQNNIDVDGVVGRQTLTLLREKLVETIEPRYYDGSHLAGELIAWEEAKKLFPIGHTARVIDLKTGISSVIYRHGGHLHADCEPCTPTDTALMFALYNGKWSWERRAVVVEVGEYRIAGSINGQPHGKCTLKKNNFNGHFCLHFYQSRLHKNGKPDPTHQRMVALAAKALKITGN